MDIYIHKLGINFTILILILLNSRNDAQIIEDSWAPVLFNGKLVYVELQNIESFKGNDIYVWTIENLKTPLEIAEVDEDIYWIKTYYLINKELRRYSLVEILYYDNANNVIKDFTYDLPSDDPGLKYNYPITQGSLVDLVLSRCERKIESKSK